MYSNKKMKQSIEDYYHDIASIKSWIKQSDAIVIGAGAGLSSAAGLVYDGESFHEHFSDFIKKYHFTDMYSAGFYPFATLEEYWGYWSRHIYYNRYETNTNSTYDDLFHLIKDKDYFVITTNVDHQFQLHGFDKKHLFYTQGDYGLFQCSKRCHEKTYDNERAIRSMIKHQHDMKIPTDLIPYCPVCGAPMSVNLRCDHTFVEDEGWHAAKDRYIAFLNEHKDKRVVFLELGVGNNTPGIIKFPFWQMCYEWKTTGYISISLDKQRIPEEIKSKSIIIQKDIHEAIHDILK